MSMRKVLVYPLAIATATAAGLFATASAASAHGYVSAPPSRQAQCAQRSVADCGSITFEPQSVEAEKGSTKCSGGKEQWKVLDDNSRPWAVRSVGTTVPFTWTFTARHRTLNWEYFVDGQKVTTVSGNNAQPEAVVTHNVDLSKFKGKKTVLAVWNIGDTPMAFYSCVDLNIGGGSSGGGDTNPPPAPSPSASKPPTGGGGNTSPKPPTGGGTTTQAPPPPGGGGGAAGEWAPNVAYKTGDTVTYQGKKYQCRQGHTSLSSWEPSIFTLALWLPV
ncbi:lytic polysaccharide monooxygenase [Virgisporangium aliadipatigenens]|uniref:lytic polysaccharide monooxygenase n=1 Tax=Virgisporangium aliadipatigenens TaxID=741659 RepID=UPI001943E2E0|nr:lytic polysaccharide monooxygenase [Virgisporangium aliadipatigenens]